MAEATHTPRPWRYGVRKDQSIWISRGDPKAGPHYQSDFYGTEQDAILTVSAPELLDALRLVYDSTAVLNHLDADHVRVIAEAIAKAEGR